MRIPMSWKMPIFTPEALAEIQSPSGTNEKKMIRKMTTAPPMIQGTKFGIIPS
jgi:hypothetical protein